MSTDTKKLTKGFTIIEVLIVLAIAGLILAIVFLAVPALQRNSRNTSIRSDAASILAGVNDFIANNQGSLPGDVTCNMTTGVVSITGSGGQTVSEAKVRGGTSCADSTAQPGQVGLIHIALNRKCTGNAISGTVTNRAVAAGFKIETTSGGGLGDQCIES